MSNPQTFWLNTTNIALGVVTLICCLVVGKAVFSEVRARLHKTAPKRLDDHAYPVEGLGLTMADGGERVDQKDR